MVEASRDDITKNCSNNEFLIIINTSENTLSIYKIDKTQVLLLLHPTSQPAAAFVINKVF